MEKILGKIEKATYGVGGYDDAMFGLSIILLLDGGGRGVADFRGTWQTRTPQAQYSEGEWLKNHTDTALFVLTLLKQAKKKDVSQLVGVPVEAIIENNSLKSWRVLTEVI